MGAGDEDNKLLGYKGQQCLIGLYNKIFTCCYCLTILRICNKYMWKVGEDFNKKVFTSINFSGFYIFPIVASILLSLKDT